MSYRLIIDTTTSSKAELMARLQQQPFILECRDAGAYREDPTLSKIEVTSQIDEYAMDEWMYEQKGVDCLGVSSI